MPTSVNYSSTQYQYDRDENLCKKIKNKITTSSIQDVR